VESLSIGLDSRRPNRHGSIPARSIRAIVRDPKKVADLES